MPRKHKTDEFDRLAEMAWQEIEGDAEELAGRIFGRQSPDSVVVTKAEQLDYYRRNWPNTQWRLGEAGGTGPEEIGRVEPEEFLRTALEAFGLPMPTPGEMAQYLSTVGAQVPQQEPTPSGQMSGQSAPVSQMPPPGGMG